MTRTRRSIVAASVALASAMGCERAYVARPAMPVTIERFAGAAPQTAPVWTAVPVAPAVRLLGRNGTPLVGERVFFFALDGRDSVSVIDARTNADGVATVGSWTLSTVAGPHELRATHAGSTTGSTITFLATATGATAGVTSILATFGSFTHTVWTAVGERSAGTAVSASSIGSAAFGVAISRSGVVYVGGDAFFARFDLPGQTVSARVFGMHRVNGIDFSPTGDTAYVASQFSRLLHIVDVATSTIVRSIVLSALPTRVVVSPDGAHLYLSTQFGFGEIVRVRTADDAVTVLTLGGHLNGLAMSGTQSALYVTNTAGTVFDVDLSTFTLRRSVSISGRAHGIAVSLDGTRLFVATQFGGLQVLDASTLVWRRTVMEASGGLGVTLTRDATQVYVTPPDLGRVTVLDAESYAVVRTIPGVLPLLVAFDASERVGVITSGDSFGTVYFVC